MYNFFKILLVLNLLLSKSLFAQQVENKQPNIIFIYADDWGWGDLSIHGNTTVKTPNIDRLAKEGTDFHDFSVSSDVCSPSRTAL